MNNEKEVLFSVSHLKKYFQVGTIQWMTHPPEGYWYSKGITIVGFLLNDGLMEELNIEAPASWDDLLKAEYEGEIIMSNPAVSGTNYAVVNALLQAKGEEDGWSYFEGLNKNIAYYAKRGSDPKNKVTTDEYAIGITYIDGTIESLLDEYDVTMDDAGSRRC